VHKDIAAIMGDADAAGVAKTGERLRAYIHAVFATAIANGERDSIRGNPADATVIRAMRPGKFASDDEHYTRIELTDAPSVIAALREARKTADGHKAAALDIWLFMAATALRPSEARLTQWSEIDLQKKLVTVAAVRMKGRKGKTKPHIVPLNALALEVLERRQAFRVKKDDGALDDDAPVFAGPNGVPPSHTNFALTPKRMGINAATPHSWRSVFRDWAGEIGNIPPDLAEMALAHKLPKIQAAYRHGVALVPRTPVMESYSHWLTGDSNVVPFQKRA
jgi:integrase